MRARRRWRHAVLSTVLAASVVTVPSAGAQTDGQRELEEVTQQRQALEQELATTTQAFEEAVQQTELTRLELDALDAREQELIAQLEEAEAAVQRRARALFKRQVDAGLGQVLVGGDVDEAAERVTFINAINARDLGDAEAAEALRIQLQQTRVLLDDTRQQLADQTSQLEALRAELEVDLAQTVELEEDLKAREARKREYREGFLNGTYSCIFDEGRFSFVNSWGAPRSGGRRHKGTDVMARHGEQVFAITNGVIGRLSNGGLGGISLYLNGDDGTRYYYTHLSGYAPGMAVGRRVEAGELVAYNGATGNAAGGAPHVHFQMHPGHGAAVNPYPALYTLCYDVDNYSVPRG